MNARLRVGLTYNLKRITPQAGGVLDDEAEYDSPSTIASIAGALEAAGHEVVKLEADASLPEALLSARPDLVFNLAEGAGGAAREAHVPALLELLRIPYTGSDPRCLVVTLDKALAKAIVADAGVAVPRGVIVTSGAEDFPADFGAPLVVKPVAEGSSKGILASSFARTVDDALDVALTMARRYKQGALVEEFLPGREFTVAVLGNEDPLALPPMEIRFRDGLEAPIYTFDHKLAPCDDVSYDVPAKVSPELDRALRDLALRSFRALGCRDVARVDVRLDAAGRPRFIECNPLPGLTPGWSDLCLVTEATGMTYVELIARITSRAMDEARRARRETVDARAAHA